MAYPLLEVKNLKTNFKTKKGIVTAIDGISFHVNAGETLGIVGESGCGKSVTALSILHLLPNNIGKIVGGQVIYKGRDISNFDNKKMRGIRGKEISMIFQDSMTSLNPVLTISRQLEETIAVHNLISKQERKKSALEILKKVGVSSPENRLKEYPHQLSGGMRQRVMIAMALSCNPSLLIADEPTTALDVTIQAQILDLMLELKHKINAAIILITHDMGVVAEMADNIMVMYAGKMMEYGSARQIFKNSLHPYTIGLLNSIPRMDKDSDRLYSINGTVPTLAQMPKGCRFYDRCDESEEICRDCQPPVYETEEGQNVRCWKYREKDNYTREVEK